MTEKNKNLLIRIVSALTALPLVLYLLFRGGLPMAVLVSFTAGVLAFELYAMSLGKLDVAQVIGIGAAAGLPFALTLWPDAFPMIATSETVVLIIVFLSYHLVLRQIDQAPARTSVLLFGVLYGGLLLTTLCGIRRFPSGTGWLLLTIVVTWLNDTGAYTFGRLFGKRKLAPHISPSKTWEGFIGGGASAVAGAFGVRFFYFHELTLGDCLVVGVVCSVLGPLGDLCESMIKRAYGVKDSGKILPGHGGLLDRVDALLFNAPFVYLYVLAFR